MNPKHFILIAVLTALAGGGAWFGIVHQSKQQRNDAASHFFDTPQKYDTTGGQPMKPRWNE